MAGQVQPRLRGRLDWSRYAQVLPDYFRAINPLGFCVTVNFSLKREHCAIGGEPGAWGTRGEKLMRILFALSLALMSTSALGSGCWIC